MIESSLQSAFDSLSLQELKAIQKKYPILFRADPLEALRLFQNQSKSVAPTPIAQSQFTELARESKLPVKVTGGSKMRGGK